MWRYRNLDICVLEALNYFAELEQTDPTAIPSFKPDSATPVMVVGSGNAILTGRYLYRDVPAVFANQDNYWHVFKRFHPRVKLNEIVIISASGKKDAERIAKSFNEHPEELPPRLLLTNNRTAPAAALVGNTISFPKLDDEPYTYNVSTYMAMLLANSKETERPADIAKFLENDMEVPRDFGDYSAYYFLVPPEFEDIGEMFNIKFREIFGCHVYGRASTSAHAKHGLFVHPAEEELVVGLDVANRLHGYRRFNLDLPSSGPVMMMAVGYYLIGQIQRRKYPWFKLNIDDYHDRVMTLTDWDVSDSAPSERTSPTNQTGKET